MKFISIDTDPKRAGELRSLLLSEGEQHQQQMQWDDEGFDRESLTRLSLCGNNLTSADAFCNGFSKLTELSLAFNSLKNLACVGQLIHLTHLDVSHNKLRSLDFAQDLINITCLKCHDNSLEDLESLKSNSNSSSILTELWVSNNKIPWTHFAHLNGLENLRTLVKYGNPCDVSSAKFTDFLLYLVPSLESIDGAPIATNASGATATIGTIGGGRSASTSTPGGGASTDVRQMINQARASFGPASSLSLRSPTRSRNRNADGEGGADAPLSFQAPRIRTGIADSPYKQQIQSQHTGNQSPEPADKINKKLGSKASRSPMLPKKFLQQQNQQKPDSDAAAGGVGGARAKEERVVKFHTRFDDAPVAACLYDNKDGYARWSKNGPVACSFENRKMLCSYKTGAIAVVVDLREGNGSVLDTRGRSLFVLSNDDTARVLDSKGAVTAEFVRGGQGQYSPSGPKMQRWIFEGMTVSFDPVAWEVKVRMQNEKVECELSSLNGFKILTEKSDEGAGGVAGTVAGTESGVKRKTKDKDKQGHGAKVSGGAGSSMLNDAEHKNIRESIQGVFSELDGLITGLKDIQRH